MPWVVVLHIIFMSAWFGCLIALPRLFAEHAVAEDPQQSERYLMMERKIYMLAMSPAAALTVITGFWLLFSHGFAGGWLPVKLLFVSLLVFTHLYQGKVLADLRDDTSSHGARSFQAQSILPALFALVIITLVVGEPF